MSIEEEITFRNSFTTDIIDTMGDDDSILRAMLVSTLKDGSVPALDTQSKRGKLRFLMRNRHGTPFEHAAITFRSEAPIFVYREWHRHRIGISINEQSGRYTEFKPVFYEPPPQRPLVQVGKPGAYEYVPADNPDDYEWLIQDMRGQALTQFASYKDRLARGYALEVARMSLGVNIYSSMYWTCNPRSLMAFLSLRTREDAYWVKADAWTAGENRYEINPGGAMFPSKPMWEIEACARAMEQVFEQAFPLTYEAFIEFGRVAP